jgi:heme/copper-type cytochrome/quinol oxidase subunit 1
MCLCVFPMHFIGLAGLPRRYYTNTNFPLFDDLQNVNVLITTFALIGGAFQLIFLYNFSVVYSTERNLFKIHGILIPSNGLHL